MTKKLLIKPVLVFSLFILIMINLRAQSVAIKSPVSVRIHADGALKAYTNKLVCSNTNLLGLINRFY